MFGEDPLKSILNISMQVVSHFAHQEKKTSSKKMIMFHNPVKNLKLRPSQNCISDVEEPLDRWAV